MVQAVDSNSTTAPASHADALYLPTDVTPEQIFQAIGQLRKEARDAIDELIRFLDKTDDYVSRELEDGADDGPCDDDELDGPPDVDDEEDDPAEDAEPKEYSLGSGAVHEHSSQEDWSNDCDHGDREDEHDGSEPDVDDEPSLGSSNDSNGHGAVYHHAQPGLFVDGEGPEDDLEPLECGVNAGEPLEPVRRPAD